MDKYIYILDYSTSDVYEIELEEAITPDDNIDIEEILREYGLKESQCSYMFTTEKKFIHKLDKID